MSNEQSQNKEKPSADLIIENWIKVLQSGKTIAEADAAKAFINILRSEGKHPGGSGAGT